MIIICEDCGKKYRVDPGKIKGQSAKFRCKTCGQIMTVSKPDEGAADLPETENNVFKEEVTIPDSTPEQATQVEMPPDRPTTEMIRPRKRQIGLRSKMFVLFFLLPMVCFCTAGVLFWQQTKLMASTLTKESAGIVSKMAEEKITDLSRAVATQCRLYLLSHPGLSKENFNNDVNFKRLAVQKVGLTGYTALYERPLSSSVWRTWAHPNENIVGIEMITLKKVLKKQFDGFWKIYTGVKDGRESVGYYTWREKDGSFRQKYMACTPIEGTPFVIAATTYIDELIQPVDRLKESSRTIARQTHTSILGIFIGALFLIGLIVSIYGHRLTGRLKRLTATADRISVGELDAEIPVKVNDEIGELADAISRMQDSIRLSIERLRRRR